jgi:glycosyltransferase involved in cell wall biosynthesis
MPEVVEDGKNGFIVEPGDRSALSDRLRWLASHPAEAAAMGDQGRRTVLERFQWSQVVQRCLDAYSELG